MMYIIHIVPEFMSQLGMDFTLVPDENRRSLSASANSFFTAPVATIRRALSATNAKAIAGNRIMTREPMASGRNTAHFKSQVMPQTERVNNYNINLRGVELPKHQRNLWDHDHDREGRDKWDERHNRDGPKGPPAQREGPPEGPEDSRDGGPMDGGWDRGDKRNNIPVAGGSNGEESDSDEEDEDEPQDGPGEGNDFISLQVISC